MIRIAYENWPENHPFRPFDAEKLREYLQLEVGWFTPVKSAATGEIYKMRLSTKFKDMSQYQQNILSERVEVYLRSMGIDIDEAMRSCAA